MLKTKKDTLRFRGDGPSTDAHFQNFINGVRTGDTLRAPIEVGAVSIRILLMANIAWQLGRSVNVNLSDGTI